MRSTATKTIKAPSIRELKRRGDYVVNPLFAPKEAIDKVISELAPMMLFEVGDFIKVRNKTYKIISYKPKNVYGKLEDTYLVFRCKEYVLEDGIMKSVMQSPNKPYITIINEHEIRGRFDYDKKYKFWEFKKRK